MSGFFNKSNFKRYRNFVNDGSTDSSLVIAKNYAQNDSRICIFEQENLGQGAARNLGIKKAKGEFLSFVDADDWVELNFLEEMYNCAKSNNCDIVATHLTIVDKKIKKNKIAKKKIYRNFEEKIKTIKNGSTCDKIFKTTMIKENGILFPQGIFWEDNLFIIKAFYYSKNYTITSKTSYNYFYHSQSTTHLQENKEKLKTSLVEILNLIVDFVISKEFSFFEFKALKEYICIGLVNFEYLTEKEVRSYLPNILKYDENFTKRGKKVRYENFLQRIFSLKNSLDKQFKVLTILGFSLRFRKDEK